MRIGIVGTGSVGGGFARGLKDEHEIPGAKVVKGCNTLSREAARGHGRAGPRCGPSAEGAAAILTR